MTWLSQISTGDAVPDRDRDSDGDPGDRRRRRLHAADLVRGRRASQPDDAGAASGLVNVAHQLGGSLGLGILVTVFASATTADVSARDELAHRIAAALTGGAVMLAAALAVVLLLIVRPRTSEEAVGAKDALAGELS